MASVQFSDEQLTAYLDGEVSMEVRVTIEAALETDGSLGERLAGLDIPLGGIGAAFGGLLAEAPAAPDLKPSLPHAANLNRGLGWRGALGVFGTGIAAGIAMMLFVGTNATPKPQAPGWKAVVASYQSLYSVETLSIPSPSDAEAQAQLAAVSQMLGADLTSLPQVAGLTFKRAQILGFNGKPLVQLAFARADGTPVALCIIAADTDGAKAMQAETLVGMSAASWAQDGRAYLLIGGETQATTQSEADAFEVWAATVADI